MMKLMGFLGATVGGYAGWALGARFGTMTAFVISMIGTGLGLYVGRQVANRVLE
jgi:hypothetical protein